MAETRLDRWLFAARFFKSRTLAAAACDGGKVDVNGHAAKPARLVRPGDLLQSRSAVASASSAWSGLPSGGDRPSRRPRSSRT